MSFIFASSPLRAKQNTYMEIPYILHCNNIVIIFNILILIFDWTYLRLGRSHAGVRARWWRIVSNIFPGWRSSAAAGGRIALRVESVKHHRCPPKNTKKQVGRSKQILLRRNVTVRWGILKSRSVRNSAVLLLLLLYLVCALKVWMPTSAARSAFIAWDDVGKRERPFPDTASRKTPKHRHNNAAIMPTIACTLFEYAQIEHATPVFDV